MTTSRFHRFLLGAALLALGAIGAARAAAPAPVAAEPVALAAFFDNPAFNSALLSPDGRYLAAVVGGQGRRDQLAVVTLADLSVKTVVAYGSIDIGNVAWVNNERLVYDTHDKLVAPGDQTYGPGLFAINRDGSDPRQLAMRGAELYSNTSSRITQKMLPWHTYLLDQPGAQDSTAIYVESYHYGANDELREVQLLQLDTVTGRSKMVPQPPNARHWWLDHKGLPRLVLARDQNMDAIHYLDPASNVWRKIIEFDAYNGSPTSFVPLAFGPDGTLYINAHGGADTSALYAFDVTAAKPAKTPLLALQGYDFSGTLVVDKNKLLGVHYTSDAAGTIWYDDAMKAMQAKVDAFLPGTVNQLTVPSQPATPWVLVQSHADTQPMQYYLYNSSTNAMVNVGGNHPHIDAARMATKELVRYKARDGLEIPAWLTLPKGASKNLPMVVLVHGGPFVRGGYWSWDADAQFLASRGYAVLEPEFRGSMGFGSKHFHAGWKQWGLAMQDDIADGTRWAIAQGIADGKRICIGGASYGGYATLMGLVNDPALYRCGINWAGVTDLDLMYQWNVNADNNPVWSQYGLPTLVGDRVRDAAQLKATSPVQQAARITQPLLLAYGSADRRVPLEHGKKFYEAVKAGNPKVELVVYQDEGHGWSLPANRIDFWGRVEKFLAQHIGKP